MELQSNDNIGYALSDDEIISLYWARDEKAIKETDNKYRNFLFAVAYNIVHDRRDCEECLNDTYIGAWNAMPPSKPKVLKSFLTVIMRRTAVNRYNANNMKKRVPSGMTESLSDLEDYLADSGNVEAEFNAKELGRILSGFIRSLPQRRRYIFMSRFYIAESIEAIASALSVSKSTVNRELRAMKADLKEKLESEGYTI